MVHLQFTRFSKLLLFLFLSGLPFGSQAGIVVVNGLSHAHQVTAGEVQKGRIEIQNSKDRTEVRVYQRDYRFNKMGEAFYDEPGTLPRSNSSWLVINPTYLTIDAGQTGFLDYEVKTPQDETLFGTYWSVIMVEEVTPLNTNSLEAGVTINTLIRYAVQISATINTTGIKELNFTGIEVKKDQGKNLLVLDIENDGDYLLRPNLVVELYDESGSSAGIFSTAKKRTYPGTSVRFEIELMEIKPGNYQALVLADCNQEDVFGINVAVSIKDD